MTALALLIASLIYATLGSPTPDRPGDVEFVIGLLLIAAVGLPRPFRLKAELAEKTGWGLLVYLLTIPLAFGAFRYPISAIMRDVIPLLFLALPLLIWPKLEDRRVRMSLEAGALLIGCVFALRYLWIARGQVGDGGADGLLYLASSPCVVFTASALPAYAADILTGSAKTWTKALILGLLAAASALALLALAISLQRAALLLSCIVYGFGLIETMRRVPRLIPWLIIMCLAGLAVFSNPLSILVHAVLAKTRAVGENARLVEFAAILDLISDNLKYLLFGAGWGARFASPAVGGFSVGYAHSFLGYVFLKTGWLGAVLWTLWFGVFLIFSLLPRLHAHKFSTFFVATLMPTILGLSLYTSYKFLGLGLVLSLFINSPQGSALTRKDI